MKTVSHYNTFFFHDFFILKNHDTIEFTRDSSVLFLFIFLRGRIWQLYLFRQGNWCGGGEKEREKKLLKISDLVPDQDRCQARQRNQHLHHLDLHDNDLSCWLVRLLCLLFSCCDRLKSLRPMAICTTLTRWYSAVLTSTSWSEIVPIPS